MTATLTPFPYLVDEPEDGGVDSRGWLPASVASTPQEAVRAFVAAYSSDSGAHPLEGRQPFEILVCERSEFLRPVVTRYEEATEALDVCAGCGHREAVHVEGCCTVTTHRAGGAEACPCIAFAPVTRPTTIEHELVGDAAVEWAREHARDEELRFHRCEPSDEGAAEWWLVEVVDGCGAHVHENGDGDLFFCCKPKGHEGICLPDLEGLPVREYFELQIIGDHDYKLANELEEMVRGGWRLSRVTYWFPEVEYPPTSTPNGDPLSAWHREHLRRTSHHRAPRAIVAAEVTYYGDVASARGETVRKGSFDPTEAPA